MNTSKSTNWRKMNCWRKTCDLFIRSENAACFSERKETWQKNSESEGITGSVCWMLKKFFDAKSSKSFCLMFLGTIYIAWVSFVQKNHQSKHFFLGFIRDPTGHWKAFANSFELTTVPITRNLDGLCEPYFIEFLIDSFRSFSHQI